MLLAIADRDAVDADISFYREACEVIATNPCRQSASHAPSYSKIDTPSTLIALFDGKLITKSSLNRFERPVKLGRSTVQYSTVTSSLECLCNPERRHVIDRTREVVVVTEHKGGIAASKARCERNHIRSNTSYNKPFNYKLFHFQLPTMYTLLVSIAVVLASLSEGARAYVGSKEMLREAGVSEALISKNIGSIKVQNDNVKVIPTEGKSNNPDMRARS